MTVRRDWNDIIKKGSIIAVVVLILSLLVWFILARTSMGTKILGKETEKPVVNVQLASSETMEKLSEGTVLVFGNPEKKHVSMIIDPEDLTRNSKIINGEPSDFLNAVKDDDIFLNLYLKPKDESHEAGTKSLIRAAACNLTTDRSSGSIVTLVKLVNAAEKFEGNEDNSKATEIMNMKKDTKCADSIPESADSTVNNANVFAQEFGVEDSEKKQAFVSDGQVVDNLDHFKSDWVKDIIKGASLSNLIDSSADVNIKQQ